MKAQLEHLLQAFRRDPKRAVVLLIVVMIAGVLWVQMRNRLPAPAAAEQGLPDDSGPGSRSIPDIGRGGEMVRSWRTQPVQHLSRNLFVSRLTQPPTPTISTSGHAARPEEEGLFWRQLEGALASRADREQYRRALEQAALQDAGALLVTSIVIGPENTALIGEKLVKRGEVVPGGARGSFTVVQIESKRVVLARDGYHVVLKLGRSGAALIAN